MKIFKKKLKKIILTGLAVSLFFIVGTQVVFGAKDLMEQAFEISAQNEQIIDIGNTKTAVGNEVFQESIGTSWKSGEGLKTTRNEGLLMHFIRLIIKISIIIAVPMIILNAIMLIVSTNADGYQKTLKTISYLTLGIIIILSSMAIIYLILSATSGTIIPELQNLQ